MNTREHACSCGFVDEVRDLMAERVDLDGELEPHTELLAKLGDPVEDRIPVPVCGPVVVRQKVLANAALEIGADQTLDIIGGPMARRTTLNVDDRAEAAQERAATTGVEARPDT